MAESILLWEFRRCWASSLWYHLKSEGDAIYFPQMKGLFFLFFFFRKQTSENQDQSCCWGRVTPSVTYNPSVTPQLPLTMAFVFDADRQHVIHFSS